MKKIIKEKNNTTKHKIIVIYYSRTGSTKKLAQDIAKRLNCDIQEIVDTVDRNGAVGYLRSGRDATLKKTTKIKKIRKDLLKYDLAIIGTPVWAWNVSVPIRTFLMENNNSLKNVAYFCTQGGSGSDKAFSEMKKLTGKIPKASLTLLTKEIMSKSSPICENKIADFIKKIKKVT